MSLLSISSEVTLGIYFSGLIRAFVEILPINITIWDCCKSDFVCKEIAFLCVRMTKMSIQSLHT